MPAFVPVRILVPFRPAVWGVLDTATQLVVEMNEFWKQATTEDRCNALCAEKAASS